MKIETSYYGKVGGQDVTQFVLENDHGVQVVCINYGCIITKMMVPDRDGHFENIVLAFEDLENYIENNTPYFGAVVGRVAGRIGRGEFQLEGRNYQLATNDNNNHLHGGLKGFHHTIWQAETLQTEEQAGLVFSYCSPDGEEGYPGELQMNIRYSLNNDNEFTIEYGAKCDQTTVLTVTNHSYFNLSGNAKRTILGHKLKINSDQYLPLNQELLPLGEMATVTDTPFDFREGRIIKEMMDFNHQQVKLAGGYDHPFILNSHYNSDLVLTDEESGRQLTIHTDEVGVVLYTANSLTADFVVNGRRAEPYLGICLETQGLPDAVHHPAFPSIVLAKGEPYHKVTKYKFSNPATTE